MARSKFASFYFVGFVALSFVSAQARAHGDATEADHDWNEYANLPQKKGMTFSHDVAPIIKTQCISCHASDSDNPSFANYSDVKRNIRSMVRAAKEGEMPHGATLRPNTKAGFTNVDQFEGRRLLTRDELATLQSWMKEGAPEGKKIPPLDQSVKKTNTADGAWENGKPDVHIDNGKFVVPPTPADKDIFRDFVLDPDEFDVDRYVTGFEILPSTLGHDDKVQSGLSKVVHHAHVFIDRSCCDAEGHSKGADCVPKSIQQQNEFHRKHACDKQGGFEGEFEFGKEVLAPWFPGGKPVSYTDGVAVKVPKCAKMVLQVHYVNNGDQPAIDSTQVGFRFSREPVKKEFLVKVQKNMNLHIPAGAKNYPMEHEMTLDQDISLRTIYPHMHQLGKDFRVEATYPDGKKEVLSDSKWDFFHQNEFRYKEPKHLPKGTKIKISAHYDNSAENPNQFNTPPKEIVWGEIAHLEMFQSMFGYTVDGKNHEATKPHVSEAKVNAAGELEIKGQDLRRGAFVEVNGQIIQDAELGTDGVLRSKAWRANIKSSPVKVSVLNPDGVESNSSSVSFNVASINKLPKVVNRAPASKPINAAAVLAAQKACEAKTPPPLKEEGTGNEAAHKTK